MSQEEFIDMGAHNMKMYNIFWLCRYLNNLRCPSVSPVIKRSWADDLLAVLIIDEIG